VRHLGILGHSVEGAALCLRSFCQEGFRELGPDDHPDVTLDVIALARSMPAWEAGDHASIRHTLSVSVERLARAGADFFVCPDNTAHMALGLPGEDLALPGVHIAELVAGQAALVTPVVSPLPTLDSTRLLARAAFEVSAGRRPLPYWRGGPIRT
jgi:aspartate racemase